MAEGGGVRRLRVLGLLLWLGVAAVFGLCVFGVMVWQAVDFQRASSAEALASFNERRALFRGQEPLLKVSESGTLSAATARGPHSPQAETLMVLAYRVQQQRIARAEIPIWFLKLKGPVAEWALRDTGFDLSRLGVTPSELERLGPGLILDESNAAGDAILVWTE